MKTAKLDEQEQAILRKAQETGLECDYLFCGISRYKAGFPELLAANLHYRYLIPTHHDEFTLPLDQFYLRNDLQRLAEDIPGLQSFEIPVLQWTELPQ